MSSLEATKADGYYYGPDFDPRRHGTLNKYRGVRPPMDKRKGGLQLIRFEMPFKCWCNRCSRVIAKGVRFNATKTCTGMYFSTKILQFSFTCPSCSNPLAIGTDPKHAEYTCVKGLRRKVEPLECFLEKQTQKEGTEKKSKWETQPEKKEKKRSSRMCSGEHEEGDAEGRERMNDNSGAAVLEETKRRRRSSSNSSNNSSRETHSSENVTLGNSSSSSKSEAEGRSDSSRNLETQSANRDASKGRSDALLPQFSARVAVVADAAGASAAGGGDGCVEEDATEEEEVLILPGVEERELLRLDPMRKLAYLSSLGTQRRQQVLQRSPCQAAASAAAAAPVSGAAAATAARAAAAAAQQQREEEEAAFEAMLAVSYARHGDPYAAHQLLRQQFLKPPGSSSKSASSAGSRFPAEAAKATGRRIHSPSSSFSSTEAATAAAGGSSRSAAAPPAFATSGRRTAAAAANPVVTAAAAAAAEKLDALHAAEEETAAADALTARQVGFRREKTLLQRYVEKTLRMKTSSIFSHKPRGSAAVHPATKKQQPQEVFAALHIRKKQ